MSGAGQTISGAVAWAESGSGAPAVEAASARAALLAQKLRLMERLLAAARQRHVNRIEVIRRLDGVQVLVDTARANLDSDQMDEAEMTLDEALRQVGAISRRSRAAASPAELRERYARLLDGVRAFRAAFDSVVDEKGEAAAATLDLMGLDAAIAAADQAARHERFDNGVRLLAEAYEMLSVALAEARANETLEHRLVFASPAEEYRYERERYLSHELLIKLMVAEREPAPNVLVRIHGEVERALFLDAQARKQASSGDYVAAIRNQEDAVGHLVRALQHGGLFVPR